MTKKTKLMLRILIGVLMLLLIAPFVFQLCRLYSENIDGSGSMGGFNIGDIVTKYWWFFSGALILYIANVAVTFWKTKEE